MKRLLDWRSDMARVTVSKEARNDLVSIRDYICDELCNPTQRSGFLLRSKRAYYRWSIFPDAASLWMR